MVSTSHILQTALFSVGGMAGAVSTFLLQQYGLSAVVASCLVGLAGALVAHLLDMPTIALVVFTGSFVGMTSTAIGNMPLMIVAGACSGLLFQMSSSVFVGIGGRLGTIAFISTLVSLYIIKFAPQKTIIEDDNTASASLSHREDTI